MSGPCRRQRGAALHSKKVADMKWWLVVKGARYLAQDGTFTRFLLLARRFRTKREAQRAARQHKGATLLREEDFDAFPE